MRAVQAGKPKHPTPQLQEVARATNVASLMYASPSWWGFTHRLIFSGPSMRQLKPYSKMKPTHIMLMSSA